MSSETPASLAELRAFTAGGGRVKYLFFWGHQPQPDGSVGPGCLSQWWPAPFVVDGNRYSTAEHYMMVGKARLFDDHEVAANVAKFGQHPDLGQYLSRTDNRVLVEASPRDRIWGIGLSKTDPRAADPDQWRGQNLLGFALMRARAELA